jgi:hypothetical protein
MQLDIHEDQPPLDREIYMVFVSKAIIRLEEDSPKVWIPVSELYPIGYVLIGSEPKPSFVDK